MIVTKTTKKQARKQKPRITKEMRRSAEAFKAQVKSEVALRGMSMGDLSRRINRVQNTLSISLRQPWRYPLVVEAIEKELFGGRVVYFGTKETGK